MLRAMTAARSDSKDAAIPRQSKRMSAASKGAGTTSSGRSAAAKRGSTVTGAQKKRSSTLTSGAGAKRSTTKNGGGVAVVAEKAAAPKKPADARPKRRASSKPIVKDSPAVRGTAVTVPKSSSARTRQRIATNAAAADGKGHARLTELKEPLISTL